MSIALSKQRIIAGRKVIHTITPKITPFAITNPKSIPSLKVMKQSAANPAMVVTELLVTDLNVLEMACAIALCLSPSYRTLLAS